MEGWKAELATALVIGIQGGPYVLERFPEAVAPLILIFKKIYFIFIS